jgi:hypothetical protein
MTATIKFAVRSLTLVAVICCLGAFSNARAAEFQARWNELAQLLAGYENVSVALPGGGAVTGDLLSVRDDSLNLDVRKVSGSRAFGKGPASIPRAQVTSIRATKNRGSWGRRIGVTVGLIAGLIGGAEFVAHVATSERSGVPSFFAVTVGSTVAGYYLGRSHDKHTLEIAVTPDAAPGAPAGQPGPAPRRPGQD